jgi:hypothetical protein
MSRELPIGYLESQQSSDRQARRQRVFELSLPGVIKGADAFGKRFEERVELRSISSETAVLPARAVLRQGSKLTLAVDIPQTLILEHPLRLVLTGVVESVLKESPSLQLVTVRLDRRFRLQSAN